MKISKIIIWFFVGMIFLHAHAQIDTSGNRIALNYSEFLGMVSNRNLNYAAEKFNVNLAQANIEAAKIFPDPNLSFTWIDNGQKRMKTGYGVNTSVSWLVELGGKRNARTRLAFSQMEVASFQLADFFRNLRADASSSYLQTHLQFDLLRVSIESYENMRQLAKADSVRFKLGLIKEIDARQSKLEAGIMLNNVFEKEAEWKKNLSNLQVVIGNQGDSVYAPVDGKPDFTRDFTLAQLIHTGILSRSDMLAALKNKQVSIDRMQLAKANRNIDIGLNLGLTNNSAVINQVSPTPSTSVVAAGISIPLKFSNKYKAELQMAKYTAMQADIQYELAESQVRAEVTTAFNYYISAGKKVQQFKTGLLEEARKMLEGKTYGYRIGEISLLEVLNAQHTYNNVKQEYFVALHGYGIALVELERAAGIWDINL